MTAAFYCAVFIAVGFLIGRWWAVAAVLPAFYWGAYEVPLENSEPPYWDVGLIFGLIALAAILAGLGLRRGVAWITRRS